jgi:hypothetical protein
LEHILLAGSLRRNGAARDGTTDENLSGDAAFWNIAGCNSGTVAGRVALTLKTISTK